MVCSVLTILPVSVVVDAVIVDWPGAKAVAKPVLDKAIMFGLELCHVMSGLDTTPILLE